MKLKQVLINVLSNSIKFTDAPGEILLTVERLAAYEDHSTLKFCVKDTGIGMDKDFLPKIFEAFSQEDASRKHKYGSTGLGMAITKSIVEQMNGTISVESEKGVGTTVTVIVTLLNSECPEPVAEPTDSKEKKRATLKGKRILLADDVQINAEIMDGHSHAGDGWARSCGCHSFAAKAGCKTHPHHCDDGECLRRGRTTVASGRHERAFVEAGGA